ncbi:hypothetical protein SOVF_020230 [Spinacia oleracea]|nr:hypothetical protein SOVF_020230 [Spinacia oleracea]
MGAFAYVMDKDVAFRNSFNDGWERILSTHPIPFYYCIGDSKENDQHLEYPFYPHKMSSDPVDNGQVKDCYHLDEKKNTGVRIKWDLGRTSYSDCEEIDSNVRERY